MLGAHEERTTEEEGMVRSNAEGALLQYKHPFQHNITINNSKQLEINTQSDWSTNAIDAVGLITNLHCHGLELVKTWHVPNILFKFHYMCPSSKEG